MDNNKLNQEKISELLLRIDGLAKSCFALEPDDLEKYKSVLRGQIHGSVSKKPDRLAALESATDEQICSMLERNVAKIRAIPETPEVTQPVEAARGPELSSDIAEEPKVTLDDLVDTKKQTFIGGVKERAKVTASLIAKRVSIKSKQSSLRDAHARIGVECVSSGKAQELFPKYYLELEEIALSIKAKETEGMAGANESVSDKAKGLLKSGKAKMEIESLKSKKKGILADLGSEFLAGDHLDSQMCVDDRESVRLLEQEIADLKNDTLELERSSGSLKKHMRTLAAVAILCVAIFAGVRFAAGFFSEEAKAERRARTARVEARRIAAEAKTEIDRIDTDIQRAESRRETDAARIRAQQQVALKERELDQKQKQIESQQQAEDQRLRKEMNAAVARQDAETQRIQEQLDRTEYVKSRFQDVGINLQILLCRSLANSGATVEIRGENWQELSDLYAEQNWLGLINTISKRNFTDLPGRNAIDRAISDFYNMQVFILVKTTFVPGRGNNLFLLTLPNPARTSQVVSLSSRWERHPDGIGYTHSWRPSLGGCVIMVGNSRTFGQAVIQFNSEYQTPVAALRQKRKLSEIDDATLELRSLEILTRVHQNAANWALTQ